MLDIRFLRNCFVTEMQLFLRLWSRFVGNLELHKMIKSLMHSVVKHSNQN